MPVFLVKITKNQKQNKPGIELMLAEEEKQTQDNKDIKLAIWVADKTPYKGFRAIYTHEWVSDDEVKIIVDFNMPISNLFKNRMARWSLLKGRTEERFWIDQVKDTLKTVLNDVNIRMLVGEDYKPVHPVE